MCHHSCQHTIYYLFSTLHNTLSTISPLGAFVFSDGVYRTGAFLFSLNKPDNQPYKMTVYRYPQYGMYCKYNYGPTFGGGHDLHIADNCDKNTNSYSYLGNTYKLPTGYNYGTTQAKTLLAGSYGFKVDEYEVFFQPGKFTSNDRKISCPLVCVLVFVFWTDVLLPICSFLFRQTLQGPFPFV